MKKTSVMSESVRDYYDRLGARYDRDRFGASSYGQYLHRQECAFLDRWLPEPPTVPVLDMGCGTGRFLARATEGVDFSAGMLEIARQKWPEKPLHWASITQTGLPDASFARAFALHVLMHLDGPTTRAFLAEAHRLLRCGGRLIVDVPSQHRRNFGQRTVNPDHWHGSSGHTVASILELGGGRWRLVHTEGFLFLPIHRIPAPLRPPLWRFDRLLCQSRLSRYASYIVLVMEKS